MDGLIVFSRAKLISIGSVNKQNRTVCALVRMLKKYAILCIPPSMLNGLSLVGNILVKSDLDGLNIIIGLLDATCTTISSNLSHFHSSPNVAWNKQLQNHRINKSTLKLNHKSLTQILKLLAATQFGDVTGGCDVTKTRTVFVIIRGSDISNSKSELPDCFKYVFCVAMYSRRNAACCCGLCKLDGLNR